MEVVAGQPIKKFKFFRIPQSLYWRPSADQKARGLWVRDWIDFSSSRSVLSEVRSRYSKRKWSRVTGSYHARIEKAVVNFDGSWRCDSDRHDPTQLKAIRRSNSQVEMVYSLYASNYIFCSLLKRGATNTLHTMYILRSKSARLQTRYAQCIFFVLKAWGHKHATHNVYSSF